MWRIQGCAVCNNPQCTYTSGTSDIRQEHSHQQLRSCTHEQTARHNHQHCGWHGRGENFPPIGLVTMRCFPYGYRHSTARNRRRASSMADGGFAFGSPSTYNNRAATSASNNGSRPNHPAFSCEHPPEWARFNTAQKQTATPVAYGVFNKFAQDFQRVCHDSDAFRPLVLKGSQCRWQRVAQHQRVCARIVADRQQILERKHRASIRLSLPPR
jgi:hypothetical protein